MHGIPAQQGISDAAIVCLLLPNVFEMCQPEIE